MMLDEIDRMVRHANPVPDPTVLDAIAGYDVLLDQPGRSHAQGQDGIDRQRHRARQSVLVGVAAAAVIAVGAVAVLQWGDDWSPANDQQVTGAPAPSAATPEELARGFVEAWGAFDADGALTYLTDDAVAAEWGNEEEFRLWLSFFDAVGTKTLNIACEQHGDSASGIVVRCTYDDHMFRSDQMGLGPYSGNYWDLTILDGTIVSASMDFEGTNEFSAQIWEPFRRWVTTEHPDDIAVMYDGSGWRISEESIPLWDQHTREYVEPRVGFVGLPPAGARPSTPERAEAVLDIESCTGGSVGDHQLTVFADGRLVWAQNADLPQGANPLSTGYLEQRLTPEGVELMRSELLASGLLRPGEQECEAGAYHGHLYDGRERPELTFTSPANEHLARITDPASWLPASAWEDREITAYVPSHYTITLTGAMPATARTPRSHLELLAAQLPAAAAELVRAKDWDYQQAGVFWHDTDLTTDDARTLAAALDDAGFEQDEQANAYHLEYHFEYRDPAGYQDPDQDSDTLVHIEFRPVLPHEVD
jgi:hypothetical protein